MKFTLSWQAMALGSALCAARVNSLLASCPTRMNKAAPARQPCCRQRRDHEPVQSPAVT